MKKFILLATLLLIFSLGACQNNESLLLALSNAEKVPDNPLANDLSLQNMVSDGSHFYLAAYGVLYKKSVTAEHEVEWDKVALPGGSSGITALAFYSGSLYLGVYKAGKDDAFYSSNDSGATWSQVTDTIVKGKQITGLWSFGSALYVAYYDPSLSPDSSFALASSSDGTNYTDTSLVSLASPVLDVVYDGGNYFGITKSAIYNISSLTEVGKPDTSDAFKGLFYSDTYSRFFVASAGGRVYSSADLSSWSSSEVQEISSTSKKVIFTHFAEINGNVLAGTANYGVFQMKDGDVSKISKPEGLSNASELNYGYVVGFYIDTPRDRVYFLTGKNGLFSNIYSGGQWSTWVRE